MFFPIAFIPIVKEISDQRYVPCKLWWLCKSSRNSTWLLSKDTVPLPSTPGPVLGKELTGSEHYGNTRGKLPKCLYLLSGLLALHRRTPERVAQVPDHGSTADLTARILVVFGSMSSLPQFYMPEIVSGLRNMLYTWKVRAPLWLPGQMIIHEANSRQTPVRRMGGDFFFQLGCFYCRI